MYLLNDKHHGISPWNDNLMSEGLCSKLIHEDISGPDERNLYWLRMEIGGFHRWHFKPICVIKLREVEEFNDDERQ